MIQGRVVVVAGAHPLLAPVAAELAGHGAFVAVVSIEPADGSSAALSFRADASDRAIWGRTAMHIEQQLGPVDGVVTDEVSRSVVGDVFVEDMTRRGHGGIVVVSDEDDVVAVVNRLVRMQR
jgi:hypothetical protein